MRYGLLVMPHPNKRYDQAMKKLAAAEWQIMTGIDTRAGDYKGLPLLLFETEGDVTAPAAQSSMGQALFSIGEGGLAPLWAAEEVPLAELASLNKYKGKTNESFTRLLINLAIGAGAHRGKTGLKVLDPVCGRGTTLYAALALGHTAWGIEREKKDTAALVTFFKQYLTYHRYKHELSRTNYSPGGKSAGDAAVFAFETVENWKAGQKRHLVCVRGDGARADVFFKGGSVDAIAADLPYGIQHAGTGEGGRETPPKFLARALPAWGRVLAPGCAMALSFNTHTLKRETVWQEMARCGLVPMTEAPYDGLEHYVEQAVLRDVAVGVKPL